MGNMTPCLWFDSNAEEAVNFYTSVFKHSRIRHVTRYGKAGYDIHGKPEGSVMTIEFELNGQRLTALNGGPKFTFTEAISFQVSCKSQQELDYYWKELSRGGDVKARQCGWLKDRYGVSWQIVPAALKRMLKTGHPEAADRVMKALLQMKKLDIQGLETAYRAPKKK